MKIIVVTAILVSSALGCDAASSRCGHVAAPVSIGGAQPLTVRVDAGALWTSTHPWAEPRLTWTMPAQGPVEDVALRALSRGGFAVTFRQGGILWRGDLDAERGAAGPLRALPHPVMMGETPKPPAQPVDLPEGDRLSTR